MSSGVDDVHRGGICRARVRRIARLAKVMSSPRWGRREGSPWRRRRSPQKACQGGDPSVSACSPSVQGRLSRSGGDGTR